MKCKNCLQNLVQDQNFCPYCGAKVIRNRLCFKNLWADFTEHFLNVDNTLIRTFVHLFAKPQVVIGGYIDGIRKKYMNPVNYFILAITSTGIMYLIIRNVYNVNLLATDPLTGINMQNTGIDVIYDYQALISYIGLPGFALVSFLIFIDKNKYNFTEHLVINAYIIGQYSIIQFLLCIVLFGFFDINFSMFSNIYLVFVLVYTLFALKKLHAINLKGILIRSLLYIPLYFFLILTITSIVFVILFFMGEIQLDQFNPKK